MKGIAEWLASIGLSEYAPRFADNAIDLSVIRDLTEQDLKDLGVLLGHRRKILRAIAELPAAPSPTETATKAVPRVFTNFINFFPNSARQSKFAK
jgi:SAM domain (Sterile alpha motif)